jgi:hypothetical protein
MARGKIQEQKGEEENYEKFLAEHGMKRLPNGQVVKF